MAARSEIPIGAPANPPAPFSIGVEAHRDSVRIAPRGELDLATVDQLQHELRRLTDEGPARIVIDLRGLEFMDSAGLHALLAANSRAQHSYWELEIIPGTRAVQRLFEITGTIDRLPFATANGRGATR